MDLIKQLKKSLGQVDIYLLDQVMKNRYLKDDYILDAGCGKGRNLIFLEQLGYNISACDTNPKIVESLKKLKYDIQQADLKNLPYSKQTFDHIVCNAVLHFANTELNFKQMIEELHRILKQDGSLFIRMTSIFGFEKSVQKNGDLYDLPDGSRRFLLTEDLINYLKTKFCFLEPLKTVNVNNLRCMSTLVLQKL